MSENNDHSFTIVELPRPKKGAPATATGAGGGAVPDAARPMLVYAMVVGYECVQGNNRFTLFGIEAGTDTGDTYMVHRRYSEFAALHAELKKTAGKHAKGLSFPKKRVVGSNFSPQFLMRRQNGLDVFVRQLVGHPVLSKQMPVLRFFLRQFYGAEVMVEPPLTPSTPKEVAAAQEEENNLLMQAEMLLMGDPDLDEYNLDSSISSWGGNSGNSLSSSLSSIYRGDSLQGSSLASTPPSGGGSADAYADQVDSALPYQEAQPHAQAVADSSSTFNDPDGGEDFVAVPMPLPAPSIHVETEEAKAKAAFETFLVGTNKQPSAAPTPTPTPPRRQSKPAAGTQDDE